VALNQKLANVAANAAADAVVDQADAGLLRIYDGTQPANADTAVTTQTLLAELTFGTPAFGNAVAGVATANAITQDAAANATGTATWFRVVKVDGTTTLWDGSVGTATANLILSTTSINTGDSVSVSACTYTAKKTG
jgi:hypothetical protein